MAAPIGPVGLSELDVACGIAFDARPRPLRLPPATGGPQAAIEQAVLRALLRPPCLVSFSGGRDSSLVLAAATRVARREGLELPIPATNRFTGAVAAEESRWQEQVIAHLGLTDWLRLSFTDELDLIGPYAQRLLRAHGLLWPFNVHFHLPLIDAARGGSLLTGAGGDELFGAALRGRLATVLSRAAAPRPRDLARTALAVAPRGLRRRALQRRRALPFAWLRPDGLRAARRAAAAQEAAEPFGLRARMGFALGLRYLRVARASLALAASDADVLLDHPLCAPQLWSAIARAGAPHGFADRSTAMRATFAGWLPDELLAREDKASFDEVFWHWRSRDFAARWDGGGLPHDLVDAEALRRHWGGATPAAASFTPLQLAALRSAGLDEGTGAGRERPASVVRQH